MSSISLTTSTTTIQKTKEPNISFTAQLVKEAYKLYEYCTKKSLSQPVVLVSEKALLKKEVISPLTKVQTTLQNHPKTSAFISLSIATALVGWVYFTQQTPQTIAQPLTQPHYFTSRQLQALALTTALVNPLLLAPALVSVVGLEVFR